LVRLRLSSRRRELEASGASVEKPKPDVGPQERPKLAVLAAVLCGVADELVSAPTAGELVIAPREEELDGLDVKVTELVEEAVEAEDIIDVIYLKLIPK
jgi:hypothetical protein